ncbi:unnamed protein product [Pleuronectes platessa]|uniref:Uncharacterized protein n=1 Tax=Pleuronectes platessa TaxID=8262 RepID=A0A9N7UI35_PLEPL|nr:unnamed protein product [Pleuronectes platessa]
MVNSSLPKLKASISVGSCHIAMTSTCQNFHTCSWASPLTLRSSVYLSKGQKDPEAEPLLLHKELFAC